ncbi:DNA/RNA non-specific endonuclease [Nocardioides sp. Soil777]|uniref:DNA/RNA non-specific endonuclease n=1 Tax=Nocardioides sp. Soil777 TaxID=1736409 RepID=UPI0009E6A94B|nr:DNA/RNA non-specific endonuclease [Nocardioides sp. Soil777]
MPTTANPAALRDYVRRHGSDFLADPNITSIGIGHKVVDGRRTDVVCVQFTVAAKVPPEQVDDLGSALIPQSVEVESTVVPTDVLERAYAPSYAVVPEAAPDARRTRIDPVVPGVSVAGAAESAGTIGCIVWDADTGAPHVLSNWHVLQGPGGAIGDEVLQPGPYDDNRVGRNRLGVVTRSHLGIAGDAAIATIEDRGFDATVLDLGVAPVELGDPELDDPVVKSGRTTAVTHGRVSRVDVIVRLDYGEAGEHRIGCFEIRPDPARPPVDGELSDGGDSGSAWIFKAGNGRPTRVLAGLHFAGETDGRDSEEHALACLPRSVFDKLGITLSAEAAAEAAAAAGAAGYDEGFLSTPVAVPTLAPELAADAVEVDGDPVVPYTHFSLTMSTSRRLARWVAWNVDGTAMRRLERSDDFRLDPRVPADAQVGEELYADNRLDRGHLARRADLTWGTAAEAAQANSDSFFFTNIAPQIDAFNQASRYGVWGRLEDALYEAATVDRLRISVFGGPVLRDDDREYRGVLVPREFWKVIAWEEDGVLTARAFLLTQDLDPLEAIDLGEFETYQVPLDDLASRTGVLLDPALSAGEASGAESVAAHVVTSEEDVVW